MLTTALIGYGNWGPNVARNIAANPAMQLFAVCDIKPDRMDAARQIYGERVACEADYRVLLRDPTIQAVAVAVETSSHYAVARDALEAGKHVYVEKPFTASVAEAAELSRVAAAGGLTIHVDHLMMYHPAVRIIKSMLDTGELGDLLYIDAMRMNMGTIKPDVNVMWDLAVHDLAVIDFLSGGREPLRVLASGRKIFSLTEAIVFLTLEYPGFPASVRASWITPARERRLTVVGSHKTAVFDELKPSGKLTIYDTGMEVESGSDPGDPDYSVRIRSGGLLVPELPLRDVLFQSIDHFAAAVTAGTPSLSGPEQAIRVQKILTQADREMMS